MPSTKTVTDTEIVEAVAEKVMGWKRDGERTDRGLQRWESPDGILRTTGVVGHRWDWSPLADAQHDYQVLEKLREAWHKFDLLRFNRHIHLTWYERRQESPATRAELSSERYYCDDNWQQYRPGDFTRAAWEAVQEIEALKAEQE